MIKLNFFSRRLFDIEPVVSAYLDVLENVLSLLKIVRHHCRWAKKQQKNYKFF
jgi:hypothetical protein